VQNDLNVKELSFRPPSVLYLAISGPAAAVIASLLGEQLWALAVEHQPFFS
jgi:hypothetical protein